MLVDLEVRLMLKCLVIENSSHMVLEKYWGNREIQCGSVIGNQVEI